MLGKIETFVSGLVKKLLRQFVLPNFLTLFLDTEDEEEDSSCML